MTVHVDSVGKIRVYEEPSGSFATDHSDTIGDFIAVPYREGSANFNLDEPLETPLTAQQLIDAQPIKVHMPKRGRFSFEINLAGLGLGSSARTQGALGRLLKVALGGEFLGTGTTVNDAGATTSLITFTSAANFRAGGAAAFATGTGGRLEMREIKSISTNTVTLKHALSSAPANGSTVFPCATYYLGNRVELGDANMATSLQLLYEGLEPDDRWLFLGGQLASPIRFTIANGGIPTLAFEWQFAQWFQANGNYTAGDFVGDQLTTTTYSDYRPVVVKDSDLRMFYVGTTAIALTPTLNATSYEFNTSIAYWPHLAPGGTNNIVGYHRLRTVPIVSGTFTLPYEDDGWYSSKMLEDVLMAFSLQLGSSPTVASGGGVLLSAPTVQVTNFQRVSIDGITGQQVSWEGTTDQEVTSPSTSLGHSALRIHLF